MNRRAALALFAGSAGLTICTGCLTDGKQGTIANWLGWDDKPRPPKFAPASLEAARRVDTTGQKIIDQNTFTGLTPIFHTIGVPEPVLFHRGTAELFISEGLVKKCKSEAELAAVLCSELGKMKAEKDAARALGRDQEPIVDLGLPGLKGVLGEDRAAVLAKQEKRSPNNSHPPPAEPDQLARQFLQGAGFSPDELERVQPLLQQSDRGNALRKQMAGSAPTPKWEE